MIRELIRAVRLSVAAAFAIVFPGGVASVVQSDDMVRLSSPMSLDAEDLDFSTRVESHRNIYEVQYDGGGSPTEVNLPRRIDWANPLG